MPDPVWREPPDPELPEFVMPDEDGVERPTIPKPPRPLPSAGPKYGGDWTGMRPTQPEMPPWEARELRAVGDYKLPPAKLTDTPIVEKVLLRLHHLRIPFTLLCLVAYRLNLGGMCRK